MGATHNKKEIALCIGALDTKKHRAKGASATHSREKNALCAWRFGHKKT